MRIFLKLFMVVALFAAGSGYTYADYPLSDVLTISDGTVVGTTTFQFVDVDNVDMLVVPASKTNPDGVADVPHPLPYSPSTFSGTFSAGSNYLVLNDTGGTVSDILRLDIMTAPLVAPSLTFNFYDGADPLLPALSCSATGVTCLSEAGFDTLQNVTGYLGLANTNMSVMFQSNDVSVSAIPEPEIYAMLGFGLALMGFLARRKREQQLRAAI